MIMVYSRPKKAHKARREKERGRKKIIYPHLHFLFCTQGIWKTLQNVTKRNNNLGRHRGKPPKACCLRAFVLYFWCFCTPHVNESRVSATFISSLFIWFPQIWFTLWLLDECFFFRFVNKWVKSEVNATMKRTLWTIRPVYLTISRFQDLNLTLYMSLLLIFICILNV